MAAQCPQEAMAFRMASTYYPSLCFSVCQETRCPPGLSEGVVQTPRLMQEGEPQTKRRMNGAKPHDRHCGHNPA